MKRFRFVIFISLLSLFLIYAACDRNSGSFDTAYAFRGIITDAESGLPVEGVWVVFDLTLNVDSSAVHSDSGGYYNFPFWYGAGEKDTTLYFGKDGYETFDTIVTIMAPGQSWDTIDVVLAPIDFIEP